ncbi:MAG: dihydrolipoyl dehydrogenase [Halobacteriota archaeon]|nr:dihydrolipoyl dehydrogenase [Halobacteriota archaeon]
MKEYDVIVIGSGSAMSVVDGAMSHGMDVALVDKGPLGGTCLNLGCIPSKMLIYPADRIVEIQEAEKLGIKAEIKDIDFKAIMERMRRNVSEGNSHMRAGIEYADDLGYYEGTGRFISEYTMEVNSEKIKGEKIFIASGARPLIPPIKGIDQVDYLTNEEVLLLEERPDRMIIIGGGYIAAEYSHFFSAMGTDVTILQRAGRLVPNSEPEISELLKKVMEKRMKIFLNTEAVEVKEKKDEYVVVARDISSGKETEFTTDKIMIAAGRRSNADLLDLEKTGLKMDDRGFIPVNDYLETEKENIWAFGDVIGKHMFRHAANREANVAWHNAIGEEKVKMQYDAIPNAVFSHPQIASVGKTEEEAKREHMLLIGEADYSDVAKGQAMLEDESFTKAIVDKNSMQILGFHIIGPYAPILIQEVIDAMATGGSMHPIARGMHIHPALSELILSTLGNLRDA